MITDDNRGKGMGDEMADVSKAYGEGKHPIPAIAAATVIFMINHSLAGHPWTEVNIYRATQCAWGVGPETRAKAVYALGVSHGVVRGAYRIERWRQVTDRHWCFDGRSAPELNDVVGKSIARLKAGQGASTSFRVFLDGILAPASEQN